MSVTGRRQLTPYVLLVPGMLWLGLFFLVPMFMLGQTSLQEGSVETGFRLTWHVATYGEVLGRYSTQFLRSFQYAGVTTIVTLLIGYPLAYMIAFRAGRWRNALLLLVVLPFFSNFLIRTLSWKLILADNGPIVGVFKAIGLVPDDGRLLATTFAVLAGLVYNFLPFMVLPIYVSLEKIDRRLIEAGSDLYGSPFTTFRKVTLPLSLPGVVGGTLLTFIPAAGDFVNARFLGTPGQSMIGNVIESRFLTVSDYPAAAALSFLLLASILVFVVFYLWRAGTEELL